MDTQISHLDGTVFALFRRVMKRIKTKIIAILLTALSFGIIPLTSTTTLAQPITLPVFEPYAPTINHFHAQIDRLYETGLKSDPADDEREAFEQIRRESTNNHVSRFIPIEDFEALRAAKQKDYVQIIRDNLSQWKNAEAEKLIRTYRPGSKLATSLSHLKAVYSDLISDLDRTAMEIENPSLNSDLDDFISSLEQIKSWNTHKSATNPQLHCQNR